MSNSGSEDSGRRARAPSTGQLGALSGGSSDDEAAATAAVAKTTPVAAAAASRRSRSRSSSSSGDDITFSVTVEVNAKHTSGGDRSHTSYRVITNTNAPDFDRGEVTVVRRFRDFVWLQTELGKENAGTIVPPLPEKREWRKFDARFVEFRRRGLQKFLRRCAEHRALRMSQAYKQFLTWEEPLPTSVSLMGDLVSVVRGLGKFKMSELHAAALRENEYFEGQQETLISISKSYNSAADSLVVAGQSAFDWAEGVDEIADMILELSKTQTSALSDSFAAFTSTAEKVALLERQMAATDCEYLWSYFSEYVRGSAQASAVVTDRAKVFVVWQDLLAEYKARSAAAEAARAKPGKEAQAAKLLSECEGLQEEAAKNEALFNKVTRTLEHEFDRFHDYRLLDAKQALMQHTHSRTMIHQKKRALWSDLSAAIRSGAHAGRSQSHSRSADE